MSRRASKVCYWQDAPMPRDQIVLFAETLEERIPADHPVGILDEILDQMDWADWEGEYHQRKGQPPIHPSMLCKVLLFAMIRRKGRGTDPQENPAHLPTTDADARILPNKEGGYAPNYTPLAGCPYATRCRTNVNGTRGRKVTRDVYEEIRKRHSAWMRQKYVRRRYSRRLHFGETPFAVLKAALDLRRFLLRSHLGVQQEWRWGCSAYHLKKLIRLGVGLRAEGSATRTSSKIQVNWARMIES